MSLVPNDWHACSTVLEVPQLQSFKSIHGAVNMCTAAQTFGLRPGHTQLLSEYEGHHQPKGMHQFSRQVGNLALPLTTESIMQWRRVLGLEKVRMWCE